MNVMTFSMVLLMLNSSLAMPALALDSKSLNERIAEKKSNLPGCSPDLIKWLLEMDETAQHQLKTHDISKMFSSDWGNAYVDLYFDQSGKIQKLGGPYSSHEKISQEGIEASNKYLSSLISNLSPRPVWFKDRLTLHFFKHSAKNYEARFGINNRYLAPLELNSVDKFHGYLPKEDPSTDKWLADLGEDLSNDSYLCSQLLRGPLLKPGEKLRLSFRISREGWLKYISLDVQQSSQANQQVIQALVRRLPRANRPRNTRMLDSTLEIQIVNDKLQVKCFVNPLGGRIGEISGISSRDDDE